MARRQPDGRFLPVHKESGRRDTGQAVRDNRPRREEGLDARADGGHTGRDRPLRQRGRRRHRDSRGNVPLRVALLQARHPSLRQGTAERLGPHTRFPTAGDAYGRADVAVLRCPHQCRRTGRLLHHRRQSEDRLDGDAERAGLHFAAELHRRQRLRVLGGVLAEANVQQGLHQPRGHAPQARLSLELQERDGSGCQPHQLTLLDQPSLPLRPRALPRQLHLRADEGHHSARRHQAARRSVERCHRPRRLPRRVGARLLHAGERRCRGDKGRQGHVG